MAELTGRRYLSGYASDDTQYAALMSAGATFAQQYGLRPGIALSAAQMATLTSDIVWLQTQTVTLADGSTQDVLVPKVYVAQAGANALKPSGALINGDDIHIEADNIVNRGGSIGDAKTQRAVVVASADIVNQGGVIQADAVGLKAGGDIFNETLTKTQSYGQNDTRVQAAGSITSLSNVARIEAKNQLVIDAGRDVVDAAGKIGSGGAASITAGRDVNFNTVTTGSSYHAQIGASSMVREATQANVGQVTVGKDLQIVAGRDLTLNGTQVSAGNNASLAAGRNVIVDAATSSQASDQRSDPAGNSYRQTRSETTVQGASVKAGGDLVAIAGTKEAGDLTVTGSQLDAKGATRLGASQNIVINAARETRAGDDYSHRSSSNPFAQRSSTERDVVSSSTVVGSRIGGGTLALVAGNDITTQAAQLRADGAMSLSAGRDIQLGTAQQTTTESHLKQESKSATGLGKLSGIALGADTVGAKLISSNAAMDANAITRSDAIGTTLSAASVRVVSGRDTTVQVSTVVADNDITMLAGRNLTIESAQNTRSGNSQNASSKSGMIGSWSQPSFGNVKQEEANQGSSTTQSGSQIASLQGDVTLIAGNTYRQTASSVMALGQAGPLVGGDVNVLAKNVVINQGFDTGTSNTQAHSASTVLGGSASIGGISTDTLRGASNTVNAMGNTSDSRMQALGAANLAMQGKQAYDAAATVAAGGGVGYKVSVNVSRSKSESQSSTQASEAVGSTIAGANNVNIIATGGGQDSNIRAVGSTIAAGNTVNLAADNQIDLQASKSTYTQQGTNNNSGASIGLGFAAGSQNGFTLELGASRGKGHANGSDVTYTNTQVSGGRAVNVQSGGDMSLKGAVIAAPKVTADVGGNLNIESLQDTSTQVSKQSSSGLNASLCIPPFCYGVSTVGGSAASAKANGDFASVTEQSGIKAGDGGFDMNVNGNTDLKGGVISSTQAAVDGKKNSFTTASLATSDIENRSTYAANGYAVSGSVSGAAGDQSAAKTDADKAVANNAAANSKPGGSAGVGNDSGVQTSRTKAGISGMAGDTSVRTVDDSSAGALVKTWDANALVGDVQAQAAITQEFGQRASYEVGNYADRKYNELKTSDPAEAAKWAEGGEYRVATHAASGLLAGGVGGALGAGASAALMPRIGEAIEDMGLPAPVAQAVGAATAAAIGAAAGGGTGAASAYNVDVNNRQLHPTEESWLRAHAKEFAKNEGISEQQALERLTQQALKNVDYLWRAQLADGDDASAKAFLTTAQQRFTNELGESQQLFTTTGQQLLRPEMFADSTDPAFYKQFAQSGLSRDMNTGLLKELKDSGVDLKNGAVDLVKVIKENPDVVLSAAWNAVIGLPKSVVDSFKETGGAIGEGAAVALNGNLTEKLNAIYGSDVTGYQQALLAIRVTAAITGAASTAKAGTQLGEATATAVGKKLDEVLDQKALHVLAQSGGVYDKSGNALLDLSKLSTEQKGVMGDLFGQNTVKQIVPDGQKIARVPGVGETGIDDLYKVSRPDVDFVNIEYKFVGDYKKAGSSSLGSTLDGKQGSESWFLGSDRLEKSVGVDQARDVAASIKAGRTETWVVTTRPDGSTELQVLDALAKPKAIDTSTIVLPKTNLSGAKR